MNTEANTALAECKSLVRTIREETAIFDHFMEVNRQFSDITSALIEAGDYAALERMTCALERVLDGQ